MSIENGENGYVPEEETKNQEEKKQNLEELETNQDEDEVDDYYDSDDNDEDEIDENNQEEANSETPKHEWENIIHGMVHYQEKDYQRRIVDKIILLHDDRRLSEFVKPSPENENYKQPTPVNNEEIGLAKEAKKEFDLSVEVPEPIYGAEILSQDDWKKLLNDLDIAWKNAQVDSKNPSSIKINLDYEDGTYYTKSESKEGNFLSIRIGKEIEQSSGSSGGGDLTPEMKKEFKQKGFTDQQINSAEEAYQKWCDYMEEKHWEPNRQKEAQRKETRKQYLINYFGLNKIN